jgi:hypothetical protein
MTHSRLFTPPAIAATGLCVAGMLMMPVASADTLPNGLTVTCSPDSEIHTTCIIGGCPRVNGDYVVDAVHTILGGAATTHLPLGISSQQEYGFECIHGSTARQGVDMNGPFTISVQGCRKNTFSDDMCTPFSTYNYNPPAKPSAPVPAQPQKPAPGLKDCPAGSLLPVVPVGRPCQGI